MKLVVPRESAPSERRVALVPDSVARLEGVRVVVEAGAGESAGFVDDAYRDAGAEIAAGADALYNGADLVVRVRPPSEAEVDRIPEGAALVSLLEPYTAADLLTRLMERRITGLALELVPRITRAQRMDVLSSQSTVAGYEAVVVGAGALGKFLPMLTTAAGTIPPAKVLVLGAGVAGLQAIATARRLGAVVEAFDIRPAVKEQVESLGATFVGLGIEETESAGGYAKEVSEDVQRREHELLEKHVRAADLVVTTALVPGRAAPVLITDEMVASMRPGSVIVDLAAEAGGNCELTEAGESIVRHGVRIIGYTDLPSRLATHASQMFSRNVVALLQDLVADGELRLDPEDELVRGCLVTREGEIVHEGVRERLAVAG